MRVNEDRANGRFILQNDEGKEIELSSIHLPGNRTQPVIQAAFGWMEPDSSDESAQKHWFVVGCLCADKTVLFLEEHSGPLHKLVPDAIDAKDRLLITHIWVDRSEERLCWELNSPTHDGLTTYHSYGRNELGIEQYHHKTGHWPSFRGRDITAPLAPVWDQDKANFKGCFEALVYQVSGAHQTKLTGRMFKLVNLIALPFKETYDHPCLRAAVWLHSALRRSIITATHQTQSQPTYRNPPRGVRR